MDSHNGFLSNSETGSVEAKKSSSDSEYEFIEDLFDADDSENKQADKSQFSRTMSYAERAYTKYLLAKDFFQSESYELALTSVEEAINLYKSITQKTNEEWQALTICYEFHREIYQQQTHIALVTSKKMLNMLKKTRSENQEVKEEIHDLREEYNSFADMITGALSHLSQVNNDYKLLTQNLNLQIQVLEQRTEPSIMEHIANEIRNKFQAISHYSFHNLARSLFSFFSAPRNEEDGPTHESNASLERIKIV